MAVLPRVPEAARSPALPSIRRVLVATDLSAVSDGATAQALELARDLGAKLVVLSVIEPPGRAGATPAGPSPRIDQVRAARESAAQALVAQGGARGIAVDFLVWVGDPGESIVNAAESEAADLIVVGSHGRGGVGRLLIGSVSEYVVRNATCPVMVVRSRMVRTVGPAATGRLARQAEAALPESDTRQTSQ